MVLYTSPMPYIFVLFLANDYRLHIRSEGSYLSIRITIENRTIRETNVSIENLFILESLAELIQKK